MRNGGQVHYGVDATQRLGPVGLCNVADFVISTFGPVSRTAPRRSNARTAYPRAQSAAVKCRPTKPVAPVTRISGEGSALFRCGPGGTLQNSQRVRCLASSRI